MDFIVAQQAKNAVEIDRLIESHRQAEHRFDRDERVLKLMIRAGRRARHHMREQDERWERRHADLLKSQAHTDARLDALIDIVRRQHNGAK